MHPRNRRNFLLTSFGAAALWGQQNPVQPVNQEGDPVFKAETRLVQLHATVIDKRGNFVTDLPQTAFKVFEDGKEMPLRLFRREDVPVSMGLIIDNSASMRNKRKQVEQAAISLIKASNPLDEAFVVNFNEEAYIDVNFTNDVKKMQAGLEQLNSRGGTALRDALSLSMDHLKQKGKRDKKVLLVVTDGEDSASSTVNTLEKLLQKAQRSEVLLFAIGIMDDEENRRREVKRAKRDLDLLTKQSGGVAHFPSSASEVEPYALQIAREIRSQYTLAYSPSKPDDGAYRQVKVTVKASGSPSVRTRAGYYATPAGRADR